MLIRKFYKSAVMITLLIASAISVNAQKREGHSKADRQKWEAEMTQYKHDLLTKELGISNEQATRFFSLYDAMDRERRAVFSKDSQMRKEMKQKVKPTDKEYAEATNLSLSVNASIHRIETKYYQEFTKVLSAKQIYQLRLAEQKLNHEFRKHVRELSKNKKK